MEDKKKITIPKIVEEVQQEMCDRYCRFPHFIKDEDELMDICSDCPMHKLG